MGAGNLTRMAVEKLPDLDIAAVELLRLERQEKDLAHVLGVVGSRNERFPNVVTEQRIEQMRETHAAVRRRMLELRGYLEHRSYRPARKTPNPSRVPT